MTRRLIINADDFGWTDGHNQAVRLAYEEGVLNSASLMATGDAFDEAAALTKQLPELQIGVHLVLSEGQPLTGQTAITRPDGWFYDEVSDWIRVWLSGKLSRKAIRQEWRAQIERILSAGIMPFRLDGHKHIHLIPPLLDIAIELAKEYQIASLRLPLEPLSGLTIRRGLPGLVLWVLAHRAKCQFEKHGITFAQPFYGIAYSGAMTTERLHQILANLKKKRPLDSTAEIMVHPAVITPAVHALKTRYAWARSYQFESELAALCDSQTLTTVQEIIG